MTFITLPSQYPLKICSWGVHISVHSELPYWLCPQVVCFQSEQRGCFQPRAESVQIRHHWRHQPGLLSWGKTTGISQSLSLAQLLFPLHSREKNWHSSRPTLGGFKGAVIQQMKCRESSAESRGTIPITIHLSETVNCRGRDKNLFKLWPTKLNDPCTSNFWLYYVNITWLQVGKKLVLS